jgi:hypothetical protein
MMDKAVAKWSLNPSVPREVHSELSAFTLDVVADTAFSVDFKSFDDTTKHSSFLQPFFFGF